MADDKTKKDLRDRNRVSAEVDYEVARFARENGLTPDEVRALINISGTDRARLAKAAKTLRHRLGR